MRKRHNVKNQIEDESRKKNTEKSKKKIRHILEWLWAFIFVSNTRKKNRKKKVLDRFAFYASFRYILSSFFCFMERTLYVHVSLKFGCSFLFWHSCERCSGMEETVIPIFVFPNFFRSVLLADSSICIHDCLSYVFPCFSFNSFG